MNDTKQEAEKRLSSDAVVHAVKGYLSVTENWIYHHMARPGGRQATVWAIRKLPGWEQFPCGRIHSLDSLSDNELGEEIKFYENHGWWKFFEKKAAEDNVGLIHAHFGPMGLWALPIKSRLGVPLVTSFYGADLSENAEYLKGENRYRRLFERGDAFIVEGSHSAGRLKKLGCPESKIHVVHLGVDEARFPFVPRKLENGEPLKILMISRLVEKKGTVYALRAIGEAIRMRPGVNIHATLVGDGPMRETVLAEIGRLGLGGRVDWRPSWDYEVFVERLPGFHILLQHSVTAKNGEHEGGAPVSILEAQLSGMPIVSTRHADIPEYMKDGESGILTDERDVEGCAKAIIDLADHHQSWPKMGKAGREHVLSSYNLGAQMRRLESIYASLMRNGRGGSRETAPESGLHHPADLTVVSGYFSRKKMWEQSEKTCLALIKLDPENQHTRLDLAKAVFRLGRHDEALGILRFAPEDKTVEKKAALIKAEILFDMGEWDEALSGPLDIAVTDDGRDELVQRAEVWVRKISLKKNDLKALRESLERSLNDVPSDAPIAMDVAHNAFMSGVGDQSARALISLENFFPTSPYLDFYHGLLAYYSGEMDEALERLERHVDVFRKNPEIFDKYYGGAYRNKALLILCQIHSAKGDGMSATRHALSFSRENPNDMRAAGYIAHNRQEAESTDGEVTRRVMEWTKSQSPDQLFHAANAAVADSLWHAAEELLSVALKKDKSHAPSLYLMGSVRRHNGDAWGAATFFGKAADIAEDAGLTGRARFQLAGLAREADDHKLAVKHLKLCLEAIPNHALAAEWLKEEEDKL